MGGNYDQNKPVAQGASFLAIGDMKEVISFYRDAANMVEKSHPVYLDLPHIIAGFSDDQMYLAARPYGRFQYRDEMYVFVDELDQFTRSPLMYSRSEVGQMIKENIIIGDPRLAAALPLPWRIGFVVGWLSGLAVSQKDDALAGLVVLAALVRPLMSSLPARQASGGFQISMKKLRHSSH